MIPASHFDFEKIKLLEYEKKPRQNRHGNKSTYLKAVCAFDIETTNLKDIKQSFCYLWQFSFDEYGIYYGRTISTAIKFFKTLADNVPDGATLVIYVFNLAFEFHFLSGVYKFTSNEVFAVAPHKPIKCTMYDNKLELRDAQILSNNNLAGFLNDMQVAHKKLDGDIFDYTKIRFPWSELSTYELQYGENDVIGLVEAVKNKLKFENDTIYTIPLTATGYARRDIKKEMKKFNHNQLMALMPTLELYYTLSAEFRGGNVHANRFFSGDIVTGVYGADISSSYPTWLVNKPYPMKPFQKVHIDITLDHVERAIYKRGRAVLFTADLSGIKLKNEFEPFPYLAYAKCINVTRGLLDNGRLLEADTATITINDIDYKILKRQYDFEVIEVKEIWISSYGMLPECYRNKVKEYYKTKTALKNKSEDLEDIIAYGRSKALLNSLYGLSAQRPVRQSIVYNDTEWIDGEEDPAELLAKYNRKNCLPYQWGCWCTAWARYELDRATVAIMDAGAFPIYCDTDSIYYTGGTGHELDKINEEIRAMSEKNEAFAYDYKGQKHYMGVWEYDDPISKFKTLGAKKYCYIQNGKLKLTCAGVNKRKGADELKKHGGIKAFEDGFVFREAGGTCSYYNTYEKPIYYKTNEGRSVKITNNIYIEDDYYTLGLTGEYTRLLSDIKMLKNIFQKSIDNNILW